MSDDLEPKLRSIDGFRIAPAFDTSLASLDMRHTSNAKPEDGYDITLSSSIAPQVIFLQAGSTEIEVLCEINEAEVRLTTKNTKLLPGSDYLDISDARKAHWTKSVDVESSNASSTGKGLKISPSGPGGDITSATNRNIRHSSEAPYDPGFYHSKLEVLRMKFSDSRVLDGPIIDSYVGWLAQPTDTTTPSGVRLDLVVREPWLRFTKIGSQSTGKLASSIRKLLFDDECKGSEKRQLFEGLLRKLAIHGLQTSNEKEATLDSVARILLPEDGTLTDHQLSVSGPGAIPIREELLQKYMSAEDTDARAVFLAISKALETSVAAQPMQKRNSKNHAPQGTVFAAIDALEKLNSAHRSEEYDIDDLKSEIGDNSYNDLSVLGFFQGKRKLGKIKFQKFGGSAEVAIFRALLQGNWFEFAETVVQENVRIGTAELGGVVSQKFDLNWSQSSMKRNGQNIKKWVINLSPSLLPPDEDHPDFFYINSFKRRAPTKGATPIITLEMARIFETEKIVRGVPYKDTAKRFGVSAGSYLNFRKREPQIAAEAEKFASEARPDLFDQ